MLIEKIVKAATSEEELRFRDRRAFYASELTKDARDLFWSLRGEKETDPTDFVGHMRMGIGKAIEMMLVNQFLSKLEGQGLKFLGGRGGQIKIGLSDPNVDGDLDGLLQDLKTGKKYVLEIKTKNGFGADKFMTSFDPEEAYLAQMGVYLKDLDAKGVTNEGIFLFLLISDSNYGEMVQIKCRYDRGEDTIYAYEASTRTLPQPRGLAYSLKIGPLLERLKVIQKAAIQDELPPATYKYKYDLTPEYVASLSDYNLEAALSGKKILGDWQIRYSRYFKKHLQVTGDTREYTEGELMILRGEWAARHPRSKKFKAA